MAEELRRYGMRATGPRLAILAFLRSDFTHPTPEEVHDALRRQHASLSLSTVYETLEAFLQAGLCRRVSARSKRLRVDGTSDDHDHAVCRGCGEIRDLRRVPSFLPPEPAGLPRGTELIGFRIEYEVLCAGCRRAAASRA
jgi:Fe2+ or Zn2+ uptake regulation protein